MSPTPDGLGYVLTSKSGQVYAYGNAGYVGGAPSNIPGNEISDISYRTDGTAGYLLISKSGGSHYAYGTPFLGNPSGTSALF